jgi:hypothetical protein
VTVNRILGPWLDERARAGQQWAVSVMRQSGGSRFAETHRFGNEEEAATFLEKGICLRHGTPGQHCDLCDTEAERAAS